MDYYYKQQLIHVSEEAQFIGNALKIYKEIKHKFIEIKEQNEREFRNLNPSIEKDNISLFNEALENLCRQCITFMTVVLEKAGLDYSITNIENTFINDYPYVFDGIANVYSIYNDNCEQLIEQYVSQEQLREYNKAMRGRFNGGGFGVKGAIQGAIFAGVANAATGAGYSIVNSIANNKDRKKLEKEILNHTKVSIKFVLERDKIGTLVKNCERAYIDAISSQLETVSFEQCIRINNNYGQQPQFADDDDPDNRLRLYISGLKEFPYMPTVYKAPFIEFGDKNNELIKLASDFGIDFKEVTYQVLRDKINEQIDNTKDIDIIEELEKISINYGRSSIGKKIINKYWKSYSEKHDLVENKQSLLFAVKILQSLAENYNFNVVDIANQLIDKYVGKQFNYNLQQDYAEKIDTICEISELLSLDFETVNKKYIKNLLQKYIKGLNFRIEKSAPLCLDFIDEISKKTKCDYSGLCDVILLEYLNQGFIFDDRHIKSMLKCFSDAEEKYGISTENYKSVLLDKLIHSMYIDTLCKSDSLPVLYNDRNKLNEISEKYGLNVTRYLNKIQKKIDIIEEKEREKEIEERTVHDISGINEGVFERNNSFLANTKEEAKIINDTISKLITLYENMDFSQYTEQLISQKKEFDEIANDVSVAKIVIETTNEAFKNIEDISLTFKGHRFNSLSELEEEKRHYVNGKRFDTIQEAEYENSFYYNGTRYNSPEEAKLVGYELDLINDINGKIKRAKDDNVLKLKEYRKYSFKSKPAWDIINEVEKTIIDEKKEDNLDTAKAVILEPLHYIFKFLAIIATIATIILFFIDKILFFICLAMTILFYFLSYKFDDLTPGCIRSELDNVNVKGKHVYFKDSELNKNMYPPQ